MAPDGPAKRVLVTGNLGYVGSVLTPMLLREGHEVVGLDSGYFEMCTFGEAQTAPAEPAVQQCRKDVRDLGPGDLDGFHAIIHLAALSNDPLGSLDPKITDEINNRASFQLAKHARQAGVRLFVFSSSCAMYGSNDEGLVTETAKMAPLTAYARSKVDAERDIRNLADDDFAPVFLRNATVFGLSPRLRFDLVVNNLAGWAHTTGRVRLSSDGLAWRPLVHVEDLCAAFLAVLKAPLSAVNNQAFNVGARDGNYQITELASIVAAVSGCAVERSANAGADTRSYRVSFRKFHETFPAFTPRWTIAAGVEQLLEAFRKANLTHEGFQGKDFTRLKQLTHLLETRRIDRNLRWNVPVTAR
jgi:nucleoside-diphosphate-sugar epimerase